RAPSLWIGEPGALGAALRLAGALSRRIPVLEVRPAIVDWRSFGRLGPPYPALLPPGPAGVDDDRRRRVNAPALEPAAPRPAARGGRAGVVGTAAELAAVVPDVAESAEVVPVRRGSPAELLRDVPEGSAVPPGGPPSLGYDPYLGYLGATAPGCGRLHLLWRR